jgi:hypothetical protein
MEERIRKNIALNRERLNRQYAILCRAYDEAALLDLAHILRVWVDMKADVQRYLYQLNPHIKFHSYTVSKRLNQALSGKKFILSGLPGGVVSGAGQGEHLRSSNPRFVHEDYLILHQWVTKSLTEVSVSQILVVIGDVSRFDVEFVKQLTKRGNSDIGVKSLNFLLWMNSEAVRLGFVNETGKKEVAQIDRSTLIERVANTLGGSHPEGNRELPHSLNALVKSLMDLHIVGLPAPYYILLKTATIY